MQLLCHAILINRPSYHSSSFRRSFAQCMKKAPFLWSSRTSHRIMHSSKTWPWSQRSLHICKWKMRIICDWLVLLRWVFDPFMRCVRHLSSMSSFKQKFSKINFDWLTLLYLLWCWRSIDFIFHTNERLPSRTVGALHFAWMGEVSSPRLSYLVFLVSFSTSFQLQANGNQIKQHDVNLLKWISKHNTLHGIIKNLLDKIPWPSISWMICTRNCVF